MTKTAVTLEYDSKLSLGGGGIAIISFCDSNRDLNIQAFAKGCKGLSTGLSMSAGYYDWRTDATEKDPVKGFSGPTVEVSVNPPISKGLGGEVDLGSQMSFAGYSMSIGGLLPVTMKTCWYFPVGESINISRDFLGCK